MESAHERLLYYIISYYIYLFIYLESLLSHKINNHISYVTTLKEGIYINYRECIQIQRNHNN